MPCDGSIRFPGDALGLRRSFNRTLGSSTGFEPFGGPTNPAQRNRAFPGRCKKLGRSPATRLESDKTLVSDPAAARRPANGVRGSRGVRGRKCRGSARRCFGNGARPAPSDPDGVRPAAGTVNSKAAISEGSWPPVRPFSLLSPQNRPDCGRHRSRHNKPERLWPNPSERLSTRQGPSP